MLNMGIMDKFKKETKAAKPAAKKSAKKVVAAEKKEAAPAPIDTKVVSRSALSVIVKPLVTEKAALMQSARTYSFVVKSSATKPQIAAAVKELYGVKPAAVRVINVQGHRVRFGKNQGKRSDYKKAMVTLKQGDSITIHEGV